MGFRTISHYRRQWKERLQPILLLSFFALFSTGTLLAQDWGEQMIKAGLVKVTDVAPGIMIDLMYSSEDNFMQEDVYEDFEEAYLTPHFAEKMARAQEILVEEKGDRYCLIIYDAARPLSIQQKMWNLVKGTPDQKYVAPPTNGGGRHNYGVAVDLSIYDRVLGAPVDMGSPVDFFGKAAHIGIEEELVNKGIITPEARENRRYFHRLMARVGLYPIRKEWWHMQERNSIRHVRTTYTLLDF